jgi:prepilin peptidase CpaA
MLFDGPDTLRFFALSAMLTAALYQDARSRRIPNTLVLAGALTGLGLAWMPAGLGAVSSVTGGMVGLVLLAPFYFLRWLGAGDVKLVAATGFFVGFPAIAQVVLFIGLAGGVLSLVWGGWTGQLRPALHNLHALWNKRTRRWRRTGSGPDRRPALTQERLPFAIAIAAGTWLQWTALWRPF